MPHKVLHISSVVFGLCLINTASQPGSTLQSQGGQGGPFWREMTPPTETDHFDGKSGFLSPCCWNVSMKASYFALRKRNSGFFLGLKIFVRKWRPTPMTNIKPRIGRNTHSWRLKREKQGQKKLTQKVLPILQREQKKEYQRSPPQNLMKGISYWSIEKRWREEAVCKNLEKS